MRQDRRMPASRPALAWSGLSVVLAVQAAVLVAMAPFYGPHRDELYFASAGQRLAWGYPDQPSFTPLMARLATEIAPSSLVVLRVPALLAALGLTLLAAHAARVFGGERRAQVLAAVVVAASAVVVATGHRLNTAVFDTLAQAAVVVLVAQSVVERRPRLWVAAGLAAGVGLNNKHAVVIVMGAVLVAVATDPAARRVLRTRWPWLGGLVAMLLWLPNLAWQARHDWPAFALSADIAEEYGGFDGRIALLVEAAVMFSPLVFLVWVAGLRLLLRSAGERTTRVPAVTFSVVTGAFLVTGGKGYYLAGVIVPLIAAGCVRLAERRAGRVVGAGAVLAASAVVAWPALVPVLPLSIYAGSVYAGLDDDQAETVGWPEYAATVRGVLDDLPPGKRQAAVVFTANYGEAGALEWYAVGAPVFSGHNGWSDWGPPPEGAGPVVVVGYDPTADFTGCRRAATVENDVGLDNEERGAPVWVCTAPRRTWASQWEHLSHYDA
jgi:hypothetical protein